MRALSQHITQLYKEIDEVEKFILLLERKISKPFHIIENNKVRGSRYAKPSIVNYVVINAANSISIIRSVIILLDKGFQHPASILMRSIIEQNSKLSYVLGGLKTGVLDKKSETFLNEYFSDNTRDETQRKPYKPITQKDIHRRNSESVSNDLKSLKEFGLAPKLNNESDEYAALQSSLYRTFSNHVHGRYPEMMDIYGEMSNNLKMNGNFESKDMDELIEVAFVAQLLHGVRRQLQLSFLYFSSAHLLKLSDEEKRFAFGGVF